MLIQPAHDTKRGAGATLFEVKRRTQNVWQTEIRRKCYRDEMGSSDKQQTRTEVS